MILLRNQSFYVDRRDNLPDGELYSVLPRVTQEATTLFVFSNLLYLAVVTAVSIGKPFRKPFYTNIAFTLNFAILFGYNFLIIYVTDSRLPDLDFNSSVTESFLLLVSGIAIMWGVFIYLFEQLVVVKYFFNLARQRLIKLYNE